MIRLKSSIIVSVIVVTVLMIVVSAHHCMGADPAFHEIESVMKEDGGILGYLYLPRWSPYIVGFGIGVLSWIAFLLSDKPLGVSTAYARTSGLIEERLRGKDVVQQKKYYQEFVPKIDWEWMLVVGLFIGAAVSALLSGDFRFEFVPPLWESMFGHTTLLRWITAFTGGILLGIGARWASGCTSGHGISGTLQLVLSSWIAALCFFIGGVATALLLFP